MSAALTSGWVPISVYGQSRPFGVDWCYLGRRRFVEPFFDETIQQCLRLPFNQLFRPQTGLDARETLAAEHPGLPLHGIIFHMLRCGSTLLAQQLAALGQTAVLSEASPIDGVLTTV
jgi:hypothetical protein